MFDPIQVIQDAVLTSVEFVHDYVQLRFDGPCLTIHADYQIDVERRTFRKGSPGFRDALCERIGRLVKKGMTVPGERLELLFHDSAMLTISLRAEDRTGPEAAVLTDNIKQVYVVW